MDSFAGAKCNPDLAGFTSLPTLTVAAAVLRNRKVSLVAKQHQLVRPSHAAATLAAVTGFLRLVTISARGLRRPSNDVPRKIRLRRVCSFGLGVS